MSAISASSADAARPRASGGARRREVETAADLVVSGHTHGGQLFPINRAGEWIGVNDKTYGHERRGGVDFIVTSGISCWALRFKTGTKSEYVMITVNGVR